MGVDEKGKARALRRGRFMRMLASAAGAWPRSMAGRVISHSAGLQLSSVESWTVDDNK